jgi:hypothetical protein
MSRSPRDIYEDYLGRRKAILRALTQDVDKFWHQCDPQKEAGLPFVTLAATFWSVGSQPKRGSLRTGPCWCSHLQQLNVLALVAQNLALYGYKDGSWAVDLPAEEVPPEAPEPALVRGVRAQSPRGPRLRSH